MEEKIRSLLYEGTKLKPLYNPVEAVEDIPSPLVIDLTRDVTNLTRIYHPNTDAVRELLAKAEAVVCDTEALAGIARKFTKALVVVAPFGFCSRPDIDNEFTIGLLNHDPDAELNVNGNRSLLKGLKEPLLVYGSPVDGVEDCEPVEDFEEFAARCDVLLLPALKDSINSVTLPLSVMVASTVVLAANSGGYYGLNPATGVFLMASDKVKPWKEALRLFESDSLKLERLKEFNMKYARRVSGESLNLISRLEQRLKNIS